MAGYSGTPLQKKLGIKPGMSCFIANSPKNYFDLISPLPPDVHILKSLKGSLDFIHIFVTSNSDFRKLFINARASLNKQGMLWVSWLKKSSKVTTDLDENIIRAYGLEKGLVDVKVCAVDEVWSALKFVYRLEDR